MQKPSLLDSVSVIQKAWDQTLRAEEVHCDVWQLTGSVYRQASSLNALVERAEQSLSKVDPYR